MILKRKALVLAALIICVVAFFATPDTENAILTSKENDMPQVILDAGHGGFDGGAVASDGTVEKNINLEISLILAEYLKSGGYKVIMTRYTDVSTDDVETDKISIRKKNDLNNRLELMNDYPNAVFVSIHLNKFTTSAANGSQIFYSGKREESSVLGEHIQKKIVSLLQPYNTRVNKKSTSSTYILHNATIPAVLVECGFLSNNAELQKLKTKEYQTQMAFCIFCGINEYFSNNKEI